MPSPLDKALGENETLSKAVDQLKYELSTAKREMNTALAERDQLKERVTQLDGNEFIKVVRFLDAGRVFEELSEKTCELCSLSLRKQGKAKLQFTLLFEPSEGQNRAVFYQSDIKVAEPKDDAPHAVMFVTKEGKLTRNNWGEPDLPGMSRGDRSDPNERDPYADEKLVPQVK